MSDSDQCKCSLGFCQTSQISKEEPNHPGVCAQATLTPKFCSEGEIDVVYHVRNGPPFFDITTKLAPFIPILKLRIVKHRNRQVSRNQKGDIQTVRETCLLGEKVCRINWAKSIRGRGNGTMGMTRDAFNHYVKTGVIQKTTIVGKHGHFAKRDIDALAMNITAAMLAAQAPDITFKKATLEDQGKEFELAVLNFGEFTKRFHPHRHELLLANPDMSYYLYDRKHMVASINIVPLSREGILKFRAGERGWLLGDYVEQYEPDKPLELIIIDFMTTPLVPTNRRTQYATRLFK